MKPILEQSAINSFMNLPEQLDKRQVEARAYELYEERGRTEGHDLEDWLTAEREVAGQRASPPLGIAA